MSERPLFSTLIISYLFDDSCANRVDVIVHCGLGTSENFPLKRGENMGKGLEMREETNCGMESLKTEGSKL